jgi:flagellar hook protein FlgE
MAAFDIPLSGLQANSSWLNDISNNLANLNTDGYKSQSVNFADIFNQLQGTSGNGDPIQVGDGVKIASTESDFSEGGLTSTGIASNMAIVGNGFFMVQNSAGEMSYTRDGDFTANSAGQLVTPAGQFVMGYPAVDGVVSTASALTPITVPLGGTIAGTPTTSFTMDTNLDSSAAAGTTFNTPLTVYDSMGAPVNLTVQYTSNGVSATTGEASWSYSITLPASATGAASATTVGSGTLTFDSSGNLSSPSTSITGLDITGLADGSAPMKLTWNLNDSSGNPTITQLDSASATSAVNQDGYGVGTLTGYTVAADGTIQGQYSNNQTLALGQVAMANFGDVQGLVQTTGGDYDATTTSGQAVIGQAGIGGNGTIDGSETENSNVDLSAQFTNMIVAQQGYEASAKALTAFDQVEQATIQLIS